MFILAAVYLRTSYVVCVCFLLFRAIPPMALSRFLERRQQQFYLYNLFLFLQVAAAPTPLVSSLIIPRGLPVSPEPEQYLKSHPFYRCPDKVVVPASGPEIIPERGRALNVAFNTLNNLRRLLKQRELSDHDSHQLVCEASTLLRYARDYMRKDLKDLSLSKTVAAAEFMLIVVDMLYVAGSILGPSSGVSKWLPELMQMVPLHSQKKPSFRASLKSHELFSDLENVYQLLGYYRACTRPPADVLVPVKQKFLCFYPTHRFVATTWQPWRDDNDEWEKNH